MSSDLKELTALDKAINTNNYLKSLNGKRTSKTLSEGERKELENLSQYKKNLKLLIEGKKAKMVPKTGQGMKSKNPYKLTSDGMFGNRWIDQEKLNDLKLEAYKDDKKVLSRKADRDFIDLLTKLQ